MQDQGVKLDQISQVRGFADQRLRLPQEPDDPSNRRISVIVQYLVQNDSEVAPADIVNKLGMTSRESTPAPTVDPTGTQVAPMGAPAAAGH
jgi:chemotaxis protein MotB